MLFDFSTVNPAVSLEYVDGADGQLHTTVANGALRGSVPYNGGAFPDGSVRWKNLGSDSGLTADLVVSVRSSPTFYSETVSVEYWPISSSSLQAVFTEGGYACITFAVRPAICASGAALDITTARCVDGTATTQRCAHTSVTHVL